MISMLSSIGFFMIILWFVIRRYKFRVRKVVVGDVTIAYRSFGRGEPLLLIGGYGSTMSVWRKSFLSQLSSRYHVIIFDNRGMGKSTLGTQKYTLEQCADDTKGLLGVLRIENVYVLGYSMGASIAQELVLKYPDIVKKLILGGANSLGKKQMKPEIQRALMNLYGSDALLWRQKLKLIFPAEWLKKHEYLFNLPIKFNREVMKKQIAALEQWGGSESRLKDIAVKTLLLVGQEDVVTPPANALDMVRQIKGAWLAQFEGCGHGLILQEPYKVASLIKAFLAN